MKFLRFLLLFALLAALLAAAWFLRIRDTETPLNRAWGNVDTRQVSLAFEASQRIVELGPEEGDAVRAGDVIGRLDTRSLEIERARARAELASLEAQADLAREGYRKEDIDAQRATTAALESKLELARRTYRRQKDLLAVRASSRQNYDDAEMTLQASEREYLAARAQLAALEAGLRPREVDSAIAQAEAARKALEALDYQIEVASILKAPASGIIRSRLAEPGDMASASRTVYQLSIVSPKWIRAYLTERQLGMVREGARATVFTDTTPPVAAQVGWISSTAEFTPKTVQTEDLRTVLVYEVRLTAEDPENRLRLGQPVTVEFDAP